MEMIPVPQKFEYNSESDTKGEFTIEPLYPGYGITVGNMLRRVLLSSITGSAITTAKIKGVDHEFSGLSYVKEDMVDVMLNIKQIKLKVDAEATATHDEPLVLKLHKTGEGKVTAGDIETPAQVSVVNKDLVIATLTDKAADFDVEFTVEKGRGYLPVESFKGEKLPIGHMAIDAIFTPIVQVSAKVDRVRVGEMTNWDKLILIVETDGSVTPEEAVDQAVDILSAQVEFLQNKGVGEEVVEEVVDEKEEEEVEEEKPEEEAKEEPEEEVNEEEPKKKRGRPKKEE